ncbi:MAG: hypothetical protein GX054_04720 [Clostridiales bacterium]|nr:hypothetical protein [Clostridiales bacterium]
MKKVIGIISIVLFLVVVIQSCAVGIGNVLMGSEEISGTAGIMLAIFMLIAGIVSIISKESKGITITSAVFYALGGLIGIANAGSYKDLNIWGGLNLLFAVLLVFHLIKNRKVYRKQSNISG